MTQEEIAEGNKLIAEFMGAEDYSTPLWRTHSDKKPEFELTRVKELRFHSSWGWLMPVVEKIESLIVKGKEDIGTFLQGERMEEVDYSFVVNISGKQCLIERYVSPQYHGGETDFLKLYDCRNNSKIESAFKSVVQFIQWHNKLNP